MIKFIIIATLIYTSFASAEANKCAALFGESSTFKDLANLKISLDVAKATGSSAIELTALADNFNKRSLEFYKFIRKNNLMTKDQFKDRLKSEIINMQIDGNQNREKNKEDERENRNQKAQLTNSTTDGIRAIFHRIKPGNFVMGQTLQQVDVELTKPFDMMATPTTQIIWKKIVELTKTKLAKNYELDEDPSAFKGPTLPVENVSYYDVVLWLRALNELSQNHEPSLKEIIADHKDGDIYRLPTDAEWEFVIRGRGIYTGHHHSDDISQIPKYAWYMPNSQNRTQPVATNEPLLFDGKRFYDMLGNVREWVQDLYEYKLTGGVDPQGPKNGYQVVTRGGGWDDSISYINLSKRSSESPSIRARNIGFRFVRAADAPATTIARLPTPSQSNVDGTFKDLAGLKIILDKAKAKGANSIELTALTEHFKNKSVEFYKLIRKNNLMSAEEFKTRFAKEVEKIQNQFSVEKKQNEEVLQEEDHIREEQSDDLKKFELDGTHIIMHRIQAGKFTIAEFGGESVFGSRKAFDLMATPTTQYIWKRVAELANAKFGNRYSFILDPSGFKGDARPVTNISYLDALEWIKALNELSAAGEPTLKDLIPDHEKGEVYRLPKEFEWEFVGRRLNDIENFGNYAWYAKNSDYQTHPVALKDPIEADGNSFYDMYGNVSEWLYGKHTNREEYSGIIGGNYGVSKYDTLSNLKARKLLVDSSGSVGFRLLREVDPKEDLNAPSPSSIDGTFKDLAGLKMNLDIAKARGVSSIELTALGDNFKQKSTEFYKSLRQHNLITKAQFKDRMRIEIANMQQSHQKQIDEIKKENQIGKEQEKHLKDFVMDGSRAVMQRIEPGDFLMGKKDHKIAVTLTKPFEMSAIVTTQIIWKRVADLAAVKFPGKYIIDPDPSGFKDSKNPVNNVSYLHVKTWIEALNELSQIGEPSLAEFISGHKPGDVYRLPTEAEWEFVLRGRGIYDGTYHFGDDVADLGKYGWYQDNSKSKVHPVASLEPLIVVNKAFYDMHGNVFEWVNDWLDNNNSELPGGIDPQGPDTGFYRVMRSGGWNGHSSQLDSGARSAWTPTSKGNYAGFRIVRDLGASHDD